MDDTVRTYAAETQMLPAVVYLSRWVDGETIKGIVVGKEQMQAFMNAITIYATLPENCGQNILVQPVPHQLGSNLKTASDAQKHV